MQWISRFGEKVTGVLRGFDRLLFRATLRRIVTAEGMGSYLNQVGVLLKDFGAWSESMTKTLREAVQGNKQWEGRPNLYLENSHVRKEEIARDIARREKIEEGPICILRAVEPCWSFDIVRDREQKKLVLKSRMRKGLSVYQYQMHPEYGFMHMRFETWLPFNVQVCMNGREWLSHMMDRAGIGYVRCDNCFRAIDDINKAQALAFEQLARNWNRVLSQLFAEGNPLFKKMFQDHPLWHYWSLKQSEWATDIMFQTPEALSSIYPELLTYAIRTFGSPDVMRFLGRRVPTHQGVHRRFAGEIVSDMKSRPEGIRVKHRINANSIKMYDKQGSVLRIETTINQPREFKVYRRPEGAKPKSAPQWLPMRNGVADIKRRAKVSDTANTAYLNALPTPSTTTKVAAVITPVTKSTFWKTVKIRPLRPFADDDLALLSSVSRGEFAINGFRNRDLRTLLYASTTTDKHTQQQRSRAVTRKLQMLRAHALIKKIPHTHRYRLTAKGTNLIATINATRELTTEQLFKLAA